MKQTAVELLLKLRDIRLFSNRKTTVFLICLLLASSFWLLNALTKTYVIAVPVPVKFEKLGKDRIVVNELPKLLNFTFEGDGFSLIGLNEQEDFDTQRIDIQKGKWSAGGAKASGYVSTRSVRDDLTRKYSGQLKVLDVAQDSILVVTDQLAGKELDVHVAATLKRVIPENKILVEPPQITPRKIEVYGPAELLSQLDYYTIDSLDVTDKSGIQDFSVPTQFKSQLIQTPVEQVELSINLEELTEAEIEVPIMVIQSIDTLEINTFPNKIKVTCAVGLSKFDQLSQNDFKAIVKAEDVKLRPARLNVYVKSLSEKVIIRSVSPQRVEYIIRKL